MATVLNDASILAGFAVATSSARDDLERASRARMRWAVRQACAEFDRPIDVGEQHEARNDVETNVIKEVASWVFPETSARFVAFRRVCPLRRGREDRRSRASAFTAR
jgi:hypothetical protein